MFTHSFSLPRPARSPSNGLQARSDHSFGGLYNDRTFFRAFLKDLAAAEREVIICSPFITKYRFQFFRQTLKELRRRNVAVFIFTRAVGDHDIARRFETRSALADFEAAGAFVIQLPGAVHEKVAVIDRKILWEGSLNILSQRESRELMRRTDSSSAACQVMAYLRLNGHIADGYRIQYERLCGDLVDRLHRTAIIRRFLIAASAVVLAWWLLATATSTMKLFQTVMQMVQVLNLPVR